MKSWKVLYKISIVFIVFTVFLSIFSIEKKTISAEEPIEPDIEKEIHEYHFDFIPYSYEIIDSAETIIRITHKVRDFENEEWVVKPISSEALISIFNPETQRWIFSNNAWLQMPVLEPEMRLKIPSQQEEVNLKLLIRNLNTVETYETPTKTLWTSRAYKNYNEKINENVKNWRQHRQPEVLEKRQLTASGVDNEILPEDQTKTFNKLLSKKNLLILNFGALFTSGIVGFTRKNDRIPL